LCKWRETKINRSIIYTEKNKLVPSILISLYQICFYGRAKRYRNLYFITEARNISLQRYASKVERVFFFSLYEDAQEGYFVLCCYKGRLSRRRINTTRKLFTVVENFELHLCYDLAPADSEAGYQTAMSPNERKVPQRGRTDEAHRSRGIKGPTTTRLWCKEDAHVHRPMHVSVSRGPSGGR